MAVVPKTSQIESSDPIDSQNRVRRPWRPQKSSLATPETPKIESGDPGDLKNRVWRPATLLSLRQKRCCLRDSNVAVSEIAALLSQRQQNCCLRDSKVAVSETTTFLSQRQQRQAYSAANLCQLAANCPLISASWPLIVR